MSEALMIALIPSILSLVGVILTVRAGNIKIMNEIKTQQAVQDEKAGVVPGAVIRDARVAQSGEYVFRGGSGCVSGGPAQGFEQFKDIGHERMDLLTG